MKTSDTTATTPATTAPAQPVQPAQRRGIFATLGFIVSKSIHTLANALDAVDTTIDGVNKGASAFSATMEGIEHVAIGNTAIVKLNAKQRTLDKMRELKADFGDAASMDIDKLIESTQTTMEVDEVTAPVRAKSTYNL